MNIDDEFKRFQDFAVFAAWAVLTPLARAVLVAIAEGPWLIAANVLTYTAFGVLAALTIVAGRIERDSPYARPRTRRERLVAMAIVLTVIAVSAGTTWLVG